MAVLTGVRVGVTDHVGVGVGDGQMAVHPLLVLDVVVNRVIIGAENDTSVAVLGDVFVDVLEVLTNEKSNSSVKRSYGSAVRAREWYREFREVGLMCLVYNIKRLVKP